VRSLARTIGVAVVSACAVCCTRPDPAPTATASSLTPETPTPAAVSTPAAPLDAAPAASSVAPSTSADAAAAPSTSTSSKPMGRCEALCKRVAACKVPSFWGVKDCMEYCAVPKYKETFVCLDAASKPCNRDHIETCLDPCQ
jgi:hypothetical protein